MKRPRSHAGVEESRFLEAYPLPWSAVIHPGMNRSTISAADDTQVTSGMNNAKAAFIVDAVNRAHRVDKQPAPIGAP